MMEHTEEEAFKKFDEACTTVLDRVSILPDLRSQEVISEALRWALDNPQKVYMHPGSKISRYENLPNLVGFGNLLDGIEQWSKNWRQPVKKIYHDRQSQFGKSLRLWHEMLSTVDADVDPIVLPGGERYVFGKVFGSKLVITGSEECAGVQVIDVVLWLMKCIYDGRDIGENSTKLMSYVIRNSMVSSLSFDSISDQLRPLLEDLFKAPMTKEQERKGQDLLDRAEANRQQNMLDFAEKKVLSDTDKS